MPRDAPVMRSAFDMEPPAIGKRRYRPGLRRRRSGLRLQANTFDGLRLHDSVKPNGPVSRVVQAEFRLKSRPSAAFESAGSKTARSAARQRTPRGRRIISRGKRQAERTDAQAAMFGPGAEVGSRAPRFSKLAEEMPTRLQRRTVSV